MIETLLLAAALAAPPATAPAAPDLVPSYLDRYFEMYPFRATEAGRHDRDRELEDPSPARIAAWVAFNRRTVERLKALLAAADQGSRDDRMDRELLLRHAERELFDYETVRSPATDPLYWTGVAGNATVFLLVRDDLPEPERLERAAARAALLPRLAARAEKALAASSPSEIAPEIAKIAAGQAAATATFYRQGFPQLAEGRSPELAKAVTASSAAAAEALDHLSAFLTHLAAKATGSPRLGAERYATLFRLYTGVEEPVGKVLEEAQSDLAAKRSEAAAYGRKVWSRYFPEEKAPADDRALLARLFARVAEDRARSTDELVADFHDLVERAFAFTREHHVVTLPDPVTLKAGRSPSYFVGQSVGGVYPAGPYAPDADTLFYLPTPPDSASPAEKDAFFRDFNHHFNVMITPHEIVPGHYVELKVAAHGAHKVRALFGDGVYTEGWGTFCERLMLDLGWGGPLDRLAHLKKQLENIARTIVDLRVHTGDMTREQVIRFVEDDAFQDQQFARNMWTRSITSAPQITSYYLGYREIRSLYEDVRKAEGKAFRLQDFMDRMIAMGPVPVARYREALLGGSSTGGRATRR